MAHLSSHTGVVQTQVACLGDCRKFGQKSRKRPFWSLYRRSKSGRELLSRHNELTLRPYYIHIKKDTTPRPSYAHMQSTQVACTCHGRNVILFEPAPNYSTEMRSLCQSKYHGQSHPYDYGLRRQHGGCPPCQVLLEIPEPITPDLAWSELRWKSRLIPTRHGAFQRKPTPLAKPAGLLAYKNNYRQFPPELRRREQVALPVHDRDDGAEEITKRIPGVCISCSCPKCLTVLRQLG